MDGITVGVSLSKLQETVRDREERRAAARGREESDTTEQLKTTNENRHLIFLKTLLAKGKPMYQGTLDMSVKTEKLQRKRKVRPFVLHHSRLYLANFNAASLSSVSSGTLSHKPWKLEVPSGPPQARGKVTSQEMKVGRRVRA